MKPINKFQILLKFNIYAYITSESRKYTYITSESRKYTTSIVQRYQAKLYMRYVLKQIQSNFLNFSLFMWFWIFTHAKLKHKSKIKEKHNAYKEMQDA